MVEITQPVDAVVAVHAGFPELFVMLAHEFGLLVVGWSAGLASVAGRTNAAVEVLKIAVDMAVLAVHRRCGVILAVALQAEPGRGEVLEGLTLQAGGRPALLGVAFHAPGLEQAMVCGGFGVAARAGTGRLSKCSQR